MDEALQEFLIESYELLDQMDRDLVALERNPSAQATLSSIFRTIHTIKGTCGFLGFSKLEAVTHIGEDLLSLLRDGELKCNPEITSGILALGDAARRMLRSIEATGTDGDGDHSALMNRLQFLCETDSGELGEAAPAPSAVVPVEDTIPASSGEATVDKAGARNAVDSNIRVDVGLLDRMMNLAGELVLARNQILARTSLQDDAILTLAAQRLNVLTTDLQEGVMKARMQPVESLWSRFPRIVRDLAVSCGKQVRLEMEGQETEMDKTILEAIKDPLTHLLRNAIDHGIETPSQRLARGKKAEGLLSLRAFHESGQVNLHISDDGEGINVERIKRKALDRKLISAEQVARMSDRDLLNLIFLPGFSTAEHITNVSGRGVGMDVVKTNIEKIGGVVEPETEPGRGTCFKIKIPLTLAITPALIVICRGSRFAIPQINLLELASVDAVAAKSRIEKVFNAPVYRLRDKLIPLIDLAAELKLDGEEVAQAGASNDRANDEVHIVVLQAGDREYGLIVDGIADIQDIVVKPLGRHVRSVSSFAGATILGDGGVALILDVLDIAKGARLFSGIQNLSALGDASNAREASDQRDALLLFNGPDRSQMAIPLARVIRLEEFSRSAIERAAGIEVVQYQGEVLPLIQISSVLQERRQRARNPNVLAAETDPLQVVVLCSESGRKVGLVVEEILDIVEEVLTAPRPASRSGALGCVIIQNRATELLDIDAIVKLAEPTFFEGPARPTLLERSPTA